MRVASAIQNEQNSKNNKILTRITVLSTIMIITTAIAHMSNYLFLMLFDREFWMASVRSHTRSSMTIKMKFTLFVCDGKGHLRTV